MRCCDRWMQRTSIWRSSRRNRSDGHTKATQTKPPIQSPQTWARLLRSLLARQCESSGAPTACTSSVQVLAGPSSSKTEGRHCGYCHHRYHCHCWGCCCCPRSIAKPSAVSQPVWGLLLARSVHVGHRAHSDPPFVSSCPGFCAARSLYFSRSRSSFAFRASILVLVCTAFQRSS